jgi:competence protein ComEC
MKRPLVAVVSCYTFGLLLGEFFQPPPVALFSASFLVLALVLVLEKSRSWLIWPLLALAGWTNLASRTAIISPNDLRSLMGDNAALVTVQGTLSETPSTRIFLRDEEEVERSLARVRVASLRRATDTGWQPALGDVVVTTPGVLPGNFFASQPIEIVGVLAPPDAPRAEGLFDYRDHLKKLGVFYTIKTASTNAWKLGANASTKPALCDRFLAWAKKTLTRGLDASDESTQLLLAMTLGQKTVLTDDVSEPFMRSGTMHIFAISGLHIALIAGILLGLLRVAQLPRAVCGLIVLPLIWFYTAATGWQPSAIRSSIMMSVVIGGWMLKRPGDLLNSLAAAAFIILLWDPQQLFQASFQLSFFVVLSIALIAPPLNQFRDRLLQTDPLLPASLTPHWRRWADGPLRWGTTCLTTSLAAWAGSLPLVALYFHLFSPVTLLANVIIVPLAGFALMAELGGLICGTWCLGLTELFNNAAWFFMRSIVGTSHLLTSVPGSFFYVPAPSWAMILIYYAVIIGATSGWLFAPRRRVWSAAALMVIAVFHLWRWNESRGETELTVLPLNGGHAVWVDAAGRKNDWLIDCGDEDAINLTLQDFLHAQGVNKIPRLVLTEGDIRNCGGARLLDDLFGVGELWTSPVHFRSSAYNESVTEFEKLPSRRKILNRGDAIGCWRILWPAGTNDFSRADDSALVLFGNFSGTKILLLSDLGRNGQSKLLAQTNNLRADIVIAGLPGVGEPLCDALLEATRPKVIVMADSEFPATRRASRELKSRLAQKGIPVIYTRSAGAVKIRTTRSGWNLQAMNGQKIERR